VNKYLKILILLLITGHGIFLLQQSYKLGFSITPSLPYHVFLIDKKNLNFKKNDFIVFQYPGENIYSFKTNEFFIKSVRCFPGNILKTNMNYEYFCNSTNIGRAYLEDSNGKKINHFVFNGVVPKDMYFVTGTHPKSWDSKYWGFVNKKRIIATAKGLL